MRKKIISKFAVLWLLVATMSFSFTGCFGETHNSEKDTENNTSIVSETYIKQDLIQSDILYRVNGIEHFTEYTDRYGSRKKLTNGAILVVVTLYVENNALKTKDFWSKDFTLVKVATSQTIPANVSSSLNYNNLMFLVNTRLMPTFTYTYTLTFVTTEALYREHYKLSIRNSDKIPYKYDYINMWSEPK